MKCNFLRNLFRDIFVRFGPLFGRTGPEPGVWTGFFFFFLEFLRRRRQNNAGSWEAAISCRGEDGVAVSSPLLPGSAWVRSHPRSSFHSGRSRICSSGKIETLGRIVYVRLCRTAEFCIIFSPSGGFWLVFCVGLCSSRNRRSRSYYNCSCRILRIGVAEEVIVVNGLVLGVKRDLAENCSSSTFLTCRSVAFRYILRRDTSR